ncbi:MAG: hypothetical protein SGPRY_003060 [Prymnesium sp.]
MPLLFQCMTGSGWTNILYMTSDGSGSTVSLIYFLTVIVLGMLFVSNLVIAVLGNAYISHLITRRERRKIHLQSLAFLFQDTMNEGQETLRDFYEWLMTPSAGESRERVRRFLASKKAFFLLITIILLSTIFTVLKSPTPSHPEDLNRVSEIGQAACSFFFVGEMLLKFYAFGPSAYLRSIWDFLDSTIVILSILDSFFYFADTASAYSARATVLSSASAFRVLRLLLISKFWNSLADLLNVGRIATKSLWALLCLLFIISYMCAIVGIMLLGNKLPWDVRHNFNDFPHAFLSVLQIVTGEDWEYVMFDAYAVNGIIGMFFCIFVTLFGHYVVLQMFVAVLTFTLQQLTTVQLQRAAATRAEETHISASEEPADAKPTCSGLLSAGRAFIHKKKLKRMKSAHFRRAYEAALHSHCYRTYGETPALVMSESSRMLEGQQALACDDEQSSLAGVGRTQNTHCI